MGEGIVLHFLVHLKQIFFHSETQRSNIKFICQELVCWFEFRASCINTTIDLLLVKFCWMCL